MIPIVITITMAIMFYNSKFQNRKNISKSLKHLYAIILADLSNFSSEKLAEPMCIVKSSRSIIIKPHHSHNG